MRIIAGVIVLILSTFNLSFSLQAQYCTPVGNCVFDDYINNFTFNTISNLNSQGVNCGSRFNPGNAYSNTGLRTNVTRGQKYAMTIASGTSPNRQQGFGIWIDFNGDQDFNDAGEFVWSSANSGTQFSDSIYIPFSAKVGLTRMRVRSQRNSTLKASQSCGNINRGESEDYLINIQAATIAPLTDFRANTTFTCDGQIKFEDLTPNQVTSWLWDFGDGNSSTLQNPTHAYTTNGTYTVSLTCFNTFGNKKETKTNYITYNASGLKRANCSPNTSSPNAGFGITNFSFATINNSSSDATAGFEDLSCIQGNATQGVSYQMNIGAPNAPANQAYRAWIDYNNDGVFSNSTELVVDVTDVKVATANVRFPANVVLNTPLRVRVAGVYTLSAPTAANYTACAALTYGQMEDYGVVVSLNTSAPVADFSVDNEKSCTGSVEFKDESTNVPTSWSWDFGDGNTSSAQNPRHTYSSSGTYTVELTSTNLYGSDKETKTSFVEVSLNEAVKPACTPNTVAHREDYGIKSVLFESINNSTQDGRVGYEDYSCSHQVTVAENTSYNIEVKTGYKNLEDVYVWIDFNNDGVFGANTEQVFYSGSDSLHKGTINIPSSAIKFKSLRMRVLSDILGTNPTPCTNPNYGQAEDYGVVITGDTTGQPQAPTVSFSADSVQSCLGTIKFTDNSTNGPSTWAWDFGDGNTSTQKNPTHQYTTAGVFTIKLTASNSFGSDTEIKTSYIEVDEKFCAPGSKDPTSSVSEKLVSSDVNLFPNPTQNKLTISYPPNAVKNIELSIITIQGQILYLNEIEPNSEGELILDVSDFPVGIHFVNLKMGDKSFTKKLITK